ncbi:hypothetical protein [Paenibacillus sp. FSL R7-0331]|uniref:hypothetical protein n=1 Tax=Paenibacillus sp. FSL R7-0331 TaxID=1536773 RepID=UPI0004F6D546|nr:hypothetical protein [Paenibacillus sp. FSL R7-0331]AIQ51325.1 hypothetical protein R70331_07250 [Paenibacillus sp. FSL R7-0331]
MFEKLFSAYPGDLTMQDFTTAFSRENPQFALLLGIAALTFFIGYMEYVYSFMLVRREKSAPYPVWMHTFYFAHDSMGAIAFALAAKASGGFWFFTVASIALVVWNLFEVYNLYKSIYVERQEIWGHLYDAPVTIKQAWVKVISQIIIFIGVVNLFRVFMHDPYMFKWFIFTNILIAIIPGFYWAKRKTQIGASYKLAIVILIGTINSFIPMNMWALTSDYFSVANNPWFYIIGVVSIGFAIRNIWILRKLPQKPKLLDDGTKTVW